MNLVSDYFCVCPEGELNYDLFIALVFLVFSISKGFFDFNMSIIA